MVNRTPLTEILFKKGVISTLYGLPDSGKTNLIVFMMQNAVTHGFHAWSIVHFFPFNKVTEARKEGLLPYLPKGVIYRVIPPEVHVIKKVSDLLLGLLRNKPNVVILDEAALFASTRAPMSKKLRYILNLSYIIRHLESSFLYCTQTKTSIPPEMREALVRYEMNIQMVTKTYRKLVVKKREAIIDSDGREIINFVPISRIGRIPLATLPWDGHYIPKFEFDLDLDEAWNRLGALDNTLEVRKHGAEVIEKLINESREEKKGGMTIKEIRDEAKELYMTLEDSGTFKKRSDLLAHLSEMYKKGFNWSYQLCRGMPFDPSKFDPSTTRG